MLVSAFVVLVSFFRKKMSDSAPSTSSSAAGSGSPPSKKKKWYNQSFCEEWLKDPEFKDWLAKDDDNQAYCRCCKKQFKNIGRSKLKTHGETASHKTNLKSAQSVRKLDSFLKKPKSNIDNVAKAEILLAGYFAEHHVPYAHADHLIDVCKKAFHDSKIAKEMNMKKNQSSVHSARWNSSYRKRRTSRYMSQTKVLNNH